MVAGSIEGILNWWRRLESNQGRGAYETPALPTELRRHWEKKSEVARGATDVEGRGKSLRLFSLRLS